MSRKPPEKCSFCGRYAVGYARGYVNERLCHSDERDCFKQVTLYHKGPTGLQLLKSEAELLGIDVEILVRLYAAQERIDAGDNSYMGVLDSLLGELRDRMVVRFPSGKNEKEQ